MTKLGKKLIAGAPEGVEIARGTSDPCPICGLNRVIVGRAHNCRPRSKTLDHLSKTFGKLAADVLNEVTTNTAVDNKSVVNKSNICQPEPIVVNQVDNKDDGVALISVNPPAGERCIVADVRPASVVTVELSEAQVKKMKDGSTDGLRIDPKRGRGRPKIAGPRPWETEGISRQAWYKRRSKV